MKPTPNKVIIHDEKENTYEVIAIENKRRIIKELLEKVNSQNKVSIVAVFMTE